MLAVLGALLTASAAIIAPPPAPAAAADGTTIDGRFSGSGMLRAGTVTRLRVAGRGGVPSGAAAVVLNVVATGARGPGYLTVFRCDAPRPLAASLNLEAGATVGNAVVAGIDTAGDVCLYSLVATNVVVDVNGYLTAGSGYRSLQPARLLDSRPGEPTIDGSSAGGGRLRAGSVTRLRVAGRGGVPSGARAVVLNVVATGARGSGYLTVFRCDGPRPLAASLNYERGATVGNAVVAGVDGDGDVCLYSLAATHVVVDVGGSLGATSGYGSVQPARLLDSRPGEPTVDGKFSRGGLVRAGSVTKLRVRGRGGVPGGARAVVLNVVATGARGSGYLTVFRCDGPRPLAASVNVGPGDTVGNAVVAGVDSAGDVCIYSLVQTHVVVDVNGSFGATSAYRSLQPARLFDSRPATLAAKADDYSRLLLDEYRVAHGLPPFTEDPAMSAYAAGWSGEMARTGFRHGTSSWAENIGFWPSPSMTPLQIAEGFHRLWVASAPHRANMLDPGRSFVGVGLYHDGSGWYGTHVFR